MARPQVILPQADAACGKVFFADRRTADGHRIALEVWNRATGRVRQGYRLAVYRCKRCAGFHIGQRPIDPRSDPRPSPSRMHGKVRLDARDGESCAMREVVTSPGRLVLIRSRSRRPHARLSPGPPAGFLLKSMRWPRSRHSSGPASRGPDHRTPHERPDPHRVDRRDLEPDPGLHQDQPRAAPTATPRRSPSGSGACPGIPTSRASTCGLVPGKLADPLRWRTPRMVFVNSMSDLFHEDVPEDYIREVVRVMLAGRLAHLPGADQAVGADARAAARPACATRPRRRRSGGG